MLNRVSHLRRHWLSPRTVWRENKEHRRSRIKFEDLYIYHRTWFKGRLLFLCLVTRPKVQLLFPGLVFISLCINWTHLDRTEKGQRTKVGFWRQSYLQDLVTNSHPHIPDLDRSIIQLSAEMAAADTWSYHFSNVQFIGNKLGPTQIWTPDSITFSKVNLKFL